MVAMGKTLATLLAASPQKPLAVLLTGDLGAGKTTLCRAIIHAMTGEDDIPSPTYSLVQTYDTDNREVWHADLYRVASEDDLEELGLIEAFEQALVLVEWPDRLGRYTPDHRLDIAITTGQTDTQRMMTMTGTGRGEAIALAIADHIATQDNS